MRAEALAAEINEWVVARARHMARTMMAYTPVVQMSGTTVLKYEDYIFEKAALIRVIAEKFGWTADDELVKQILAWADQRPEQEDPRSFVRQVTPGDHRKKLEKETIAKLNESLRPVMELFGYRA